MHEKPNFWSTTANLAVRFVILAIVILFLVNIGRSIWKNHDIQKQILVLDSDIKYLENDKINLENRILFYQTETYKEIEARRHLGYLKKGEKVVVLESTPDPNASETGTIETDSNSVSPTNNLPNWQKWWQYIFG